MFMFSLYFLSFNLMFVRFSHNLVTKLLLVVVYRSIFVQYSLSSTIHRIIRFWFNIRCDRLWVNTSNDLTRCCKRKRTFVELGRTTGVCAIVRIGLAFSLIV
jgi:hypothetical protein